MYKSSKELLALLRNDIYHIFHKSRLEQRVAFSENRMVLSVEEGRKSLVDLINGDGAFCAGRFGSVECQAIYKYLHLKYKLRVGTPILDTLCNNAGFFPKDEDCFMKFGELMLSLSKDIDFLALLHSSFGEYFLANYYCKQAKLTGVRTMDPVVGWTSALEGMKVLVIHPFTESIESQYKKRELIYPGTDILPAFGLQTIKAVQTVAGQKDSRFTTWFDALDYMTDEISKRDFDIALIGCGAYGLPLACRTKLMGKKAIHIGGALQLLFGIRGQRWDSRDFVKPFINDAWVRPSDNERPQNADKVEGACYW